MDGSRSVAREIEERPPDDHYFQCAYALLSYRCGRLDEAIQQFPSLACSPATLKAFAQSTFFKAAALWDAGHRERAREMLGWGRRELNRVAPSPDQPGVYPQDWPVVWCFAQAALHQAERLIKPVGEETERQQSAPKEAATAERVDTKVP